MTPQEENLSQDTRKKRLEADALERAAKTEKLKLWLSVLAALGFLFTFAFDRYKTRDQRTRDRQVSVAGEANALIGRTQVVLTQLAPKLMLLRLNVEAYKEKLTDLEKTGGKPSTSARASELSQFVVSSKQLADAVLAELPQNFEAKQWPAAIELEGLWEHRAGIIEPSIRRDLGQEHAKRWEGVRRDALAALSSRFAIFGSTEPDAIKKFQKSSAEFQAELAKAL